MKLQDLVDEHIIASSPYYTYRVVTMISNKISTTTNRIFLEYIGRSHTKEGYLRVGYHAISDVYWGCRWIP
jgi:hypothetical protein